MAIARLHNTLSRTFLMLSVVSLIACGGGGGGGGPKEPAPDTIPNAYSYTATTNAELSAVITSAPVTISGINTATQVSITGGEYSVNGGAFTSVAGTVTNGQSITIRLTAPAANSTSASAQLNVGSVVGTFTVTTKPDSTPDAFSFTAQTNAALNTEYTSSAITVAGIDTAVPVSITGGEYSINGGAFTSAAGTVSVNNTVRVKATSSDDNDATQAVVVTIGGVSATYSITTIPDTTPPVAEFKFPTPYTMSEAMTVKVRGTATDNNTITNVKVVVRSFNLATPNTTISSTEIAVTPKAEGDYSSWTVDVPLTALAENEIKVVATDDRENETQLTEANKVVIRQADVRSAFPDDENAFESLNSQILIDKYDGRNQILAIDDVGAYSEIKSIDPSTGHRHTSFSANCRLWTWAIDPLLKRLYGLCSGGQLNEYVLETGEIIASYNHNVEDLTSVLGMTVDRVNSRARLVMTESAGWTNMSGEPVETTGRITAFSLEEKTFSVISNSGQVPSINRSSSAVVNGDEYLIPGARADTDFAGEIISVNAVDGSRKIFSDNSIGTGDGYSGYFDEIRTASLASAVIDRTTNSLIAFEFRTNKIFSISLDTYDRKIIGNVSYMLNNQVLDIRPTSLIIDDNSEFLYLADGLSNLIIIFDLRTGEKAILSKSET